MDNFFNQIENKTNSYIAIALKKMEDFLIDKEIAISASNIKKLPRIQIKGVADNGRERLLQTELKDKFGVEFLDTNDGYNTIFPIFNNGVLMFSTKDAGTYYTHFNVISETDDFFDMEIKEYRLLNGVTYLNCIVYVEDVSKKIPASVGTVKYGGIKDFFFNNFSKDKLQGFTELELESIECAFLSDYNYYVDAILSYTLSTFRVVNFFKEFYKEKTQNVNSADFINNDCFYIKNFDVQELKNDNLVLKQNKELENIQKLLTCNNYAIIENGTIEKVINEIIAKERINIFYSAVGYAFRSGLKMIENSFQILSNNSGECELIVGALQNHNHPTANNKIDRNSAEYLNGLIKKTGIKLFTYTPAFYHGKFYYMCNDEKAFIITGSSNISQAAFKNNYELDIIHVVNKNSEQDNCFLNWYYSLREKCENIAFLDENNFEERNWTSELDVFKSLKSRTLSHDEVKQRIEDITEEEKKFRFNLWLDKKPTEIYENVEIESLSEYIMFVFADSKIVVFESLMNNNAYYVFKYKNSLSELLMNIKSMTKTQMTLSEHYVNKGYHIQYRDNLINKINRFFYLTI